LVMLLVWHALCIFKGYASKPSYLSQQRRAAGELLAVPLLCNKLGPSAPLQLQVAGF
jgi:hypothetical protein